MSSARSTLVIDSSRQSGVSRRFWRWEWRTRSSQARGCSIMIRPRSSSGFEARRVGEGVGVVGVGHQGRVGAERLAHGAQVLEVGARHDLDLDLAVAALQGRPGLLHQGLRARLDAQRDAHLDAVARAPELLRQGDPLRLRGERPGPHLQRRLGHLVPLEVLLQHGVDLLRAGEGAAEHPRRRPFDGWRARPSRWTRGCSWGAPPPRTRSTPSRRRRRAAPEGGCGAGSGRRRRSGTAP